MKITTYLDGKVSALNKSLDEALRESVVICWKLTPVLLFIWFPALVTDNVTIGQLPALYVLGITAMWLLMMKKAGMEVWVYTELSQAVKR